MFLLLFTLYSNYTFYNFNKNELIRSDAQFKRYVLPQINWIINDFEKLFTNVNILKDDNLATTIFKNILNLKNCNNCPTLGHNLDGDLRKLEQQFVFSSNVSISNYDQILALDKLTHSLHNHYLITSYKKNKLNYTEMEALSSSMILMSMPKNHRDHYQSLWHNFIKPLWQQALQSEDYLINNLGNLNIAWNTFNRKIVRGVITIDNNGVVLAERIHARWNSILRVYLRKP